MADGTWSLAEAKAKFSEVVERARTQGPQHVTRNGRDAVVVVSASEWRAANQPRKTLVDFLSASPLGLLTDEEVDALFARDKDLGRPVGL